MMTNPTPLLVAALVSRMKELPPGFKALYVELNDSYNSDLSKFISYAVFGFTVLVDGTFDPTLLEHVNRLGDFQWSRPLCEFPDVDFPGWNWLAVTREALQSREVTSIMRERGLQVIFGEHDAEVFVI